MQIDSKTYYFDNFDKIEGTVYNTLVIPDPIDAVLTPQIQQEYRTLVTEFSAWFAEFSRLQETYKMKGINKEQYTAEKQALDELYTPLYERLVIYKSNLAGATANYLANKDTAFSIENAGLTASTKQEYIDRAASFVEMTPEQIFGAAAMQNEAKTTTVSLQTIPYLGTPTVKEVGANTTLNAENIFDVFSEVPAAKAVPVAPNTANETQQTSKVNPVQTSPVINDTLPDTITPAPVTNDLTNTYLFALVFGAIGILLFATDILND